MEDGPQAPDRGQQRVYAPHDVAARLGISGAALRRLSGSYERVHGPLPRDDRGRLWPEEAVERLEVARAAVHDGRAVSVERALRAPQDAEGAAGRADVPDAAAGGSQGRTDVLELLLEELRALRGAVEGMGGRLEALERENRELREQLQLGAGEARDRQEELEAPAGEATHGAVEDRDAADRGGDQEGAGAGTWRRLLAWLGRGA